MPYPCTLLEIFELLINSL